MGSRYAATSCGICDVRDMKSLLEDKKDCQNHDIYIQLVIIHDREDII